MEQRLDIASALEQKPNVEVVKVQAVLHSPGEHAQLLAWVEQLALPELCHEERLGIVAQMRTALTLKQEKPPREGA